MDLPETEELTECPYQDEELSRDSYLSPAFSSHGDILAGRATLGDKSPLRSQVTGLARTNRACMRWLMAGRKPGEARNLGNVPKKSSHSCLRPFVWLGVGI